MALSEYRNPSVVSGLSVQDVLRMDPDEFENMEESDVRKLVGRLVSAGNKRLRNFEKRGETSPAYDRAMESGGKFSTAGKSLEELQEEFARARAFLKSESGSVRKWAKTQKIWSEMAEKNLASRRGEQGEEIDRDKLKWELFEKLRKKDPNFTAKKMKYNAIETVEVLIDKYTNEGIDPRILKSDYYVSKLRKDIYKVYEEQEALNNEFDATVSDFFN